MVASKYGLLEHRAFHDVVDYLEPQDVLAQRYRVIPAALGTKRDTGASGGSPLRRVSQDGRLW